MLTCQNRLWVVAIETPHVYDLAENLSDEITTVLPAAVDAVLAV